LSAVKSYRGEILAYQRADYPKRTIYKEI